MRCTALLSIFVLALARGASAQPMAPPSPRPASAPALDPLPLPLAELEYHVGAGLACPVADDLRAEVTRQMRYDPFVGGPGVPIGRFVVTIGRGQGSVLRVDFHLAGVGGTESVDTEFAQSPATARTCRHLVTRHVAGEIVSELTLTMMRLAQKAMARAVARAGASPACSPHAPCPEYRWSVWPDEWPMKPLEPPKPDPPKPPQRWPAALRFGVTAGVEAIASGWGSLGLAVEVGARYRFVSLDFEAHGDPSLQAIIFPGHGSVSFARVSGALLLCGHMGWLAACGVLNHVAALPPSTPYTAAGARAALEIPIPVVPPRLFLRTMVDLRATIRPAPYVDPTGTPTYFAPAAPGFAFGGGLLLELPP
jgi:hypothetical protein